MNISNSTWGFLPLPPPQKKKNNNFFHSINFNFGRRGSRHIFCTLKKQKPTSLKNIKKKILCCFKKLLAKGKSLSLSLFCHPIYLLRGPCWGVVATLRWEGKDTTCRWLIHTHTQKHTQNNTLWCWGREPFKSLKRIVSKATISPFLFLNLSKKIIPLYKASRQNIISVYVV